MRLTRNDQTATDVGGLIFKFIVAIIVLVYIFSWVS